MRSILTQASAPLLTFSVAALYLIVSVSLWRSLSRLPQALSSLWQWVALLPIVGHGVLLSYTLFGQGALYLGIGPSLSLILWLTAVIYWAASFRLRLAGLQLLIYASAALVVIAAYFLPSGKALTHAQMGLFRAHLLLSLLSYSLFTIASLQALVTAALERRLHGNALPAFLQQLPPLLSLETLLFRLLGVGFGLLTLSLATGMIFSEELTGKPLQFTHKILFGLLSWLIFGGLLYGRQRWGWRGRVALRWTLSGFIALVLAYLGTKFVLEVILQR